MSEQNPSDNQPPEEKKKSRAFSAGPSGHLPTMCYGMAAHEMTRQALKTRGSMEQPLYPDYMRPAGVPILPPYYSLRLLGRTSSRRSARGNAACCAKKT